MLFGKPCRSLHSCVLPAALSAVSRPPSSVMSNVCHSRVCLHRHAFSALLCQAAGSSVVAVSRGTFLAEVCVGWVFHLTAPCQAPRGAIELTVVCNWRPVCVLAVASGEIGIYTRPGQAAGGRALAVCTAVHTLALPPAQQKASWVMPGSAAMYNTLLQHCSCSQVKTHTRHSKCIITIMCMQHAPQKPKSCQHTKKQTCDILTAAAVSAHAAHAVARSSVPCVGHPALAFPVEGSCFQVATAGGRFVTERNTPVVLHACVLDVVR